MKTRVVTGLTEEEAEILLRMLGPQLEWDCKDDCFMSRGHNNPMYLVGDEGNDVPIWHAYVFREPMMEECSYRFATGEEAKAACERHLATGSWEQR